MAIHSNTTKTRVCDAPTEFQPIAAVLNAMDAAVLTVDLHGDVQWCNERTAQWFPQGTNIATLFAGLRVVGPFDGWLDEVHRVIDSHQNRQVVAATIEPNRRTNTIFTLRLSPCPLGPDRSAIGVVLLVLNGPASDAIEQQLEVSKRLASLGKLAARVAHELNNPLDGILRYINLSLRMVGDSEESRLGDYLAESRTGLLRMVQIIGDLLEFSRSTDGAFDAVSINEVVDQAVRSIAHRAEDAGVVLAVDYQCDDMPAVTGSRLLQVCTNLLKNAIDAMTNGGRLSIAVGLVKDNVVIEVLDNGPGLPDPPERVFEPFFTTKDPGKGTGLGLAICKDFIEEMGGSVSAANAADGGAMFTVRIPQASCRPLPALTRSPRELTQSATTPAALSSSNKPGGDHDRS